MLVTGAGLGYFAWNTFFGYVPRLYPLPISEGQWILAPAAHSKGYFRKEIFLPERTHQAWIMVSAPDSFALYINGKLVGGEAFPLTMVSGMYPIHAHLKVGKNVIGVKVSRESYPEPAQVVVEGAVFDYAGQRRAIVSDRTWRVRPFEDYQGQGAIAWHSVLFDAAGWAPVQVGDTPQSHEVAPIAFHPYLIASPPQGSWIGLLDPQPESAVFTKPFVVDQRFQGAWVRIIADETYDVLLNDVVVSRKESPTTELHIYDVGPFLVQGANTITVRVSAGRYATPRLFLDVVMAHSGSAETLFATDSTWQSIEPDRRDHAVASPAVELAEFSPSEGDRGRRVIRATLPLADASKRILKMAMLIILVLGITVMLWKRFASLLCRLNADISIPEALALDGLLHVPVLIVLGFAYLLKFDVRFDPTFPFQPSILLGAVALLMGLRLAVVIEAQIRGRQPGSSPRGTPPLATMAVPGRHHAVGVWVLAVAIGMVGFSVRVSGLDATSLYHDEVAMAMFGHAVLETGYPTRTLGSLEKPLTTYELLPYPVALSLTLFGSSDFAIRLPSAVFGALTGFLIFYIAARLWGPWTGILAMTVYVFSPFSLFWAGKAFHPQQVQFFALLTSYFFYKAIQHETPVIRPPYMYGASVCFILTYLSWEGSGLLLPALFLGLLAVKGRDVRWASNPHLWLGMAMVVVVVVLQLARRTLINVPYIVVGTGLSSSAFTLPFNNPLYNPLFYIQPTFFSPIHIVFTALLVLGLPLVVKNSAMRYYVILLTGVLFLLTHLMTQASIRYSYFAQPFLLLPACAVAGQCVGWIRSVARGKLSVTMNVGKCLGSSLFILLIILATNTQVLHLYRLGKDTNWIMQMHPGIADIDYRATMEFVKARVLPGDVIISLMPHVLTYYTGLHADYYLQTHVARQVFFDMSGEAPGYIDKYVGNTIIRSRDELKDVLHRHRRVWILATPYAPFALTNDQETLDYIRATSHVVYEAYKTKVYLWEG